jgi:hypothetical protein
MFLSPLLTRQPEPTRLQKDTFSANSHPYKVRACLSSYTSYRALVIISPFRPWKPTLLTNSEHGQNSSLLSRRESGIVSPQGDALLLFDQIPQQNPKPISEPHLSDCKMLASSSTDAWCSSIWSSMWSRSTSGSVILRSSTFRCRPVNWAFSSPTFASKWECEVAQSSAHLRMPWSFRQSSKVLQTVTPAVSGHNEVC